MHMPTLLHVHLVLMTIRHLIQHRKHQYSDSKYLIHEACPKRVQLSIVP